MIEPDYVRAHRYSIRHRKEIEASATCGCFYCLATFSPREIKSWLEEGDGTALCPFCSIDSVIGSEAGFPITEEFLAKMRHHWFD